MRRFWFITIGLLAAPAQLLGQAGTLDPSFSGDGIYTADLDPWFDELWAITVQDDGKIIGAGMVGDANDQAVLVHRLLSDGTPDSTWGNAGTMILTVPGVRQTADAIVVQSSGRVIVGGSSLDSLNDYTAMLWGLTAQGVLDSTFGLSGIVAWDYDQGSGHQTILDLQLLTDDRIVSVGNGSTGAVCARFVSDGGPDSTYGIGGVATIGIPTSQGVCLTLDGAGRTLIGGTLGYVNWLIARLDSVGDLDPGFGSGGTVTIDLSANGGERAFAISEMSDGRIVVCGYSGAQFGLDDIPQLVMLMQDGSLETGFGNGGILSLPYTLPEFGQFRDVLTMPNNKFIVAGFRQMGANPVGMFTLSRFLGDGSFDPSFAGGGQVSTDVCASLEAAWEMALAPDGSVVVGGWAATSAHTDVAVAKYFNNLGTGLLKPERSADVVSVVPCPASDFVEFSGLAENTGSTTFTFTDASGHIVHTHIDRSNDRSNSIRVQLPASMKSGAYIVTISSASSLGHARCIVAR